MVSEFGRCYRQTMQRNRAPSRYFFSDAYFRTCLSSDGTWLVLTRGADESLAAAALVVRSDGYLHHYLGCTADEHIAMSPSKNACAAVLDLADHLATPVNLGGGVSPNDGIEYFKRGFANGAADFVTHEFVCNTSLYAALAASAANTGRRSNREPFFPLYRA
jgi:CelD/BcsL family acetyltransferase involved in cellulose biosynthesis